MTMALQGKYNEETMHLTGQANLVAHGNTEIRRLWPDLLSHQADA
jgi:hypothetical protein